MKTRGRSKLISATHAVDKFYKAHKTELDSYFGNEKAAKAHLKYDAGLNVMGNNFPKKATEKLNNYLGWLRDPKAAELKNAKSEAIYNSTNDGTNIFTKMTQLNKKIDSNAFNITNKVIGNKNGFDVNVNGYYEIKNSDYVLASVDWVNGNTKVPAWEFIEKRLL